MGSDETIRKEMVKMIKDTIKSIIFDGLESYLRLVSLYVDETELAKIHFIMEYLKQL